MLYKRSEPVFVPCVYSFVLPTLLKQKSYQKPNCTLRFCYTIAHNHLIGQSMNSSEKQPQSVAANPINCDYIKAEI